MTVTSDMTAPPAMRIGDLARATGVKVETIRYYERGGVLPTPVRGSGSYRVYGPDDVERLSFIRTSRELGFTLAEVRALLSLSETPNRSCSDVDALARSHLAQVEEKLRQLESLRAELSRVIGLCRGGGTVIDCRILHALSSTAKHSIRANRWIESTTGKPSTKRSSQPM